ncbi:MAG: Glucose--fructose oxidoreductase precursor [Candidatus Hydrogenedentota bacterium]|jgi:predicted dehydrogenase
MTASKRAHKKNSTGSLNRRDFLAFSTSMAIAASPAFSVNTLGANEKITLGLMGVRNRGSELLSMFVQQHGVDVAYLVDPDSKLFRHASAKLSEHRAVAPVCEQDFRRVLDLPELDALVVATPDHWHALASIRACQAGKHVYVEKPVCHNIWEGQQMLAAEQASGSVVQAGLQNRSMPCIRAAKEYIESGALGNVHFVRVLNNKARPPLSPNSKADLPEGVNYDLWLGPAADRPYHPHHFHYNWHWFWEYSGGDIMNDAVHQFDIVRYLLDLDLPSKVYSSGGKFNFDDTQETPDTQTVLYDFPGLTVSLEQMLWTKYMKKDPHVASQTVDTPWPFNGTRIEFYGTRQQLLLARHGGGWEAFDGNGQSVERFDSRRADELHVENFLECLRGNAKPATSLNEGFKSTLLCHYGNISYRLGRALNIDSATQYFHDDHAASADLLARRDGRGAWAIPCLTGT